jgi:hypothetical protein
MAAGGTVIVSTNVVYSSRVSQNFNSLLSGRITIREWAILSLTSLVTVATSAMNIVALCWFGMWMGMTSKNANLAALKAILFVQIIPYMVITFGASMSIGLLLAPFLLKSGSSSTAFMVWYPILSTVLMSTLFLAKDIGFFILSRKTLYSSFRNFAVRSLHPIVAIPLAAPPSASAPPVIPSPTT